MQLKAYSLLAGAVLSIAGTALPLSSAVADEALDEFVAQAWLNEDQVKFPLVRPSVLSDSCAPRARGSVKVTPIGETEIMEVKVFGMPPNIELDAFVIQVPNAPFGMSWYQGDIETNDNGFGYARYVGRFNEETFVVAPNTAPAPLVHNDDFPDAIDNPPTGPVHTYHLGLWFNSPDDAAAAGCPAAVTPFNGEHNAGIQILNTSTFPDQAGPLLDIKP